MDFRTLIVLLDLIITLLIFPLLYPDQRFDRVDNTLRAHGVTEDVSRAAVSVLYDIMP